MLGFQVAFEYEEEGYLILKAADLITGPSHITIKAAAEFHDKTTHINEMWQMSGSAESGSSLYVEAHTKLLLNSRLENTSEDRGGLSGCNTALMVGYL